MVKWPFQIQSFYDRARMYNKQAINVNSKKNINT